jgi:flagellar biosynthesis chaperone FliJ
MTNEEFYKKFKKDQLIERVIKLEEQLAKCEGDLKSCKTEVEEKSTKLAALEEYKKETDNWSKGLIKTLLSDNRKLFVSELEEQINSVIDARVQDKLATKTHYCDSDDGGGSYSSILYDGVEITELDCSLPW